MKNPPCHGQTEASIEAWLRANVAIGTKVAIRNTQHNMLQYVPATVSRLSKARFEVAAEEPSHIGNSGSTYYYSGKHCFHPKGQTRLVVPTDEVISAFGEPQFGLGFSAFTV